MTIIRRNMASLAALKAKVLATEKGAAKARVAEIVGQQRRQYMTDLPGQEQIYTWKAAEARRYLSLPSEPASLDGFIFLPGEIGSTAPTAYEVAQLWLNLSDLLPRIAATGEKLRTRANNEIDAAATAEAVDAIAAQAIAALTGSAAMLPNPESLTAHPSGRSRAFSP